MENYISSYKEVNKIIIEMIYVDPAQRGQGVARKLMENFLSKEENQQEIIELHAYPQDKETDCERLKDFYESFGFEVVAGDESIGYEMRMYNR